MSNMSYTFQLKGLSTVIGNTDMSDYYLKLPKDKDKFAYFGYEKVEQRNDDDHVHDLLNEAVSNQKSKVNHTQPFIHIDGNRIDVNKALKVILYNHPFAMSQGPVILPLDCKTEDRNTPSELVTNRVTFRHDEAQRCMDWYPDNKSKFDSREIKNETFQQIREQTFGGYKVRKLNFQIQGAVSMKDMGVAYTCQQSGCIIHCSCTICQDKKEGCRLECREIPCNDCDSQCTMHHLKPPHSFNSQTDQFTVITEYFHKYRYMIPHAGIPKSCENCSEDVLEHQALHYVLHARCKFCRHAARPLEGKIIMNIEEYRKAEDSIIWNDNRTCSFCLFECKDRYERKMHEARSHKKEGKQHKCDKCDREYSNKNALEYHSNAKHSVNVPEFKCDFCGSQFISKRNLEVHKKTIHIQDSNLNTSQISCEICEELFSHNSNLNRHMKEKHHKVDANMHYLRDIDHQLMKCKLCEMKFKRRCHLTRHLESIHSTDDKIPCLICDSKFSRKDALNRHMKLKHL